MNLAMEMHDSFVLELGRSLDGDGFILLKAVVHRSQGVPGEDAGESGWQNVRMSFTKMTVEGEIQFPGEYAADGKLTIDGGSDDGLIEIPQVRVGSVDLWMCLSPNFEGVNIKGSSVAIAVEGDFKLEGTWAPARKSDP